MIKSLLNTIKYTIIKPRSDNNFYYDKEGNRYVKSKNIGTISDVESQYKYCGIRPTDIVLDIGANIGAYSMKMSNKAAHIYSVEPMMTSTLRKNISLNNKRNITVLDYALGNGIVNVQWEGKQKRVLGKSLSEIIQMCGGHIDVLKMDCEGCEWYLSKQDIQNLAKIRRIEAEIHPKDPNGNPKDTTVFSNMLKQLGFNMCIEKSITGLMIINAKNKRLL